MHYNYVVFNSFNGRIGCKEDENYYVICLKDLENQNNVIVNNYPLQGRNKFVRFLYNLHHHGRLNKYFTLPFKNIWYPYVFKNVFVDKKPICFVCLRYPSIEYLRYLKKVYPNSKIVKLTRDLIKIQADRFKKYSSANIFDVWMSYDKVDCKKYGLVHFDEFESKIDIPFDADQPSADVFFAGKAKDRLGFLIDIYDKLTSNGVSCKFYIVGAKDDEKRVREGITYADRVMTYKEMLEESVKSRCLMDINQKEAVGYTSRFLEAIMFDKLLITNNQYVKESVYFNPNTIQIIDSVNDLNIDMFKNNRVADYQYKGDFSPLKRIEQIDKLLTKI